MPITTPDTSDFAARRDASDDDTNVVIDTTYLDSRTELDGETRVFATLLSLIGGGFNEGRAALAVAAALDSNVSAECALAVLGRYAGPTFGNHYWDVRKGTNGQTLYRLLPG